MWKNYVQSVHFIIMFSSSTSIMSGWDSMYDTASDNSFANLLFEVNSSHCLLYTSDAADEL